METATINDLMIPIKEYASVSGEATVFEAIEALEQAREHVIKRRFKHRAVLIRDDSGRIIGKVRHLDVINHLEPGYAGLKQPDEAQRKTLTPGDITALREKHHLWRKSLPRICREGAGIPVKDVMHRFTATEYVDLYTPIEEAIHQMIVGRHLSLLVTRENEVIGVLRLTDVYSEICQIMKSVYTKI